MQAYSFVSGYVVLHLSGGVWIEFFADFVSKFPDLCFGEVLVQGLGDAFIVVWEEHISDGEVEDEERVVGYARPVNKLVDDEGVSFKGEDVCDDFNVADELVVQFLDLG